jgi:hypothetical protein
MSKILKASTCRHRFSIFVPPKKEDADACEVDKRKDDTCQADVQPYSAALAPKLEREYEVDARSFSEWSHVVALVCGQLTHAVGLTDICDGLDMNRSKLEDIRGAEPPKRNTF